MIQFNDTWVEDHVYDVNTFLIQAQDAMYLCYNSYFDSYDGDNEKAALQADLNGIINLYAPIIQARIDVLDIVIRKQVAISYYDDSGNLAITRPETQHMELIVLGLQMYAQSFLISYDNLLITLEEELIKYNAT